RPRTLRRSRTPPLRTACPVTPRVRRRTRPSSLLLTPRRPRSPPTSATTTRPAPRTADRVPNQGASWRERRTHDAAGQVRRLAERQAAETAQARVLIAGFLEAAEHAGITPEPLFARGYGNRGRYR